MINLPLLCPKCQHNLLRAADGVLDGWCKKCGWRGLHSHVVSLPMPPGTVSKKALWVGRGRLWLAGSGELFSLAAPFERWRRHLLPSDWQVNGLGFAAGQVIVSPGELRTLGDAKPFFAFDLASGQVTWRVESQAMQWTAPAVDEDFVCAVDTWGMVVAVHPASGERLLQAAPLLGNYPRRGIGPVLTQTHLLLVSPQGALQAFSRTHGWQRWPQPLLLANGLDFAPACDEENAYVCAGAALYAVRLEDGQGWELFRAPRHSTQGWFFSAPLVTPQGLLVLYADFDSKQRPVYSLQLIHPNNGRALWEQPVQFIHHPYFGPMQQDERVYIPDRAGHLLVLDLSDGKLLAQLSMQNEKPASAAILLDDDLFILTESGRVLRFGASISRADLPEAAETYLQRGAWEAATVVHAFAGDMKAAADIYLDHGLTQEAKVLQKAEVEPKPPPIINIFRQNNIHIDGNVIGGNIISGDSNSIQLDQ